MFSDFDEVPKVYVNLEVPEKNYTKKGGSMCVNDGFRDLSKFRIVKRQFGQENLGWSEEWPFLQILGNLAIFGGAKVLRQGLV